MKNYRIGKQLTKDIKSQVRDWKKYALAQVEETSARIVDIIGKLFVERARENLVRNGYDTARYAGNIYYDPRWKQVVVRGTPEEPDIMWYLEFGTGIAGKKAPHPQASQNGWQYAINENTVNQAGSSWRTNANHPDGIGWWVSDNGLVYLAEDDILGDRPHFFTSGIPPVRYLYDTMMALPELIEKAKQILNAERK